MSFRLFYIALFLSAVFFGFRMGKTLPFEPKAFPLTEDKSFAISLYAYKDGKSIEKTLRSIFEQNYENFRVICFDDNSQDGTFEKVKGFVLENKQEGKVILIQNNQRLGPVASQSLAADTMRENEIVIPLTGKDTFSHPNALSRLNEIYQNPNVWLVSLPPLLYPSFRLSPPVPVSFYAALFKEIRLADLIENGRFKMGKEAYLAPILQMAHGRQKVLDEPLLISSYTRAQPEESSSPYPPLAAFPKREGEDKAEIVIFSCDRPLQLFASLESIYTYVSGFDEIYVLCKASTARFEAGYEKVASQFPEVHFIYQEAKKDFKPKLLSILSESPHSHVMFATDDDVVKDFTDLTLCMEMMSKTKAYGFYLRLGSNISYCYQLKKEQQIPKSVDLGNGIFAWNIEIADSDWGFPNTVDMTLYKKSTVKTAFEKLNYRHPNSLEFTWAKDCRPSGEIGLFFQTSKILNIPLNIVSRTGNPHMNYMSPLELLAKFEQGFKIDIDPLYKIENPSPHFEYYPEFILR